MPRTKQTARLGGASNARVGTPCFGKYTSLRKSQRLRRVSSLHRRVAKNATASSATSRAAFSLFPKLPRELRTRIWEMATEDRRIVTVRSTSFEGLRSPVPSILHVCSESRAIGLSAYTLNFASQKGGSFDFDYLPPRVYFNFERDILFFRRDWNAGVEGPWCCISYLKDLINLEDLQRVKAVGFDLKALVCSGKADRNHLPILSDWTGLKTFYLGLEKRGISPVCEIELQDLQPEDYSAFIDEYCKSSSWYQALTRPEGAAGMEWIKNYTVKNYSGYYLKPEGFCKTLSPVSIIKL